MQFDTVRFLDDNFGSVEGVIDALSKHFSDLPEREAVRKWFFRGSVPSAWFAALLVAADRERHSALRLYFTGGCADVFG
jgi:hypothetical protein